MNKKIESTSWDLIDDPSLDPETKKNIVENTTAEVRGAPILGLLTTMPGGIEASERRGQDQFVASDILPTEIQDPYVDGKMEVGSAKKILQAWGFTFGKVVDGDPLFTQARLPPGWSKKGSSHAMWTTIVDDQGRERCSMFYKAAFYDRSAFLSISPRYKVEVEFEDEKLGTKSRVRGRVLDGTTVLFTTEWQKDPEGGYVAFRLVEDEARQWFKNANFPSDVGEQWARP